MGNFVPYEDIGSGGVQTVDLATTQVEDWWATYLVGLDQVWKNDTGANVKVGVIDTGGTNHVDLVYGIDRVWGPLDTIGHGTLVAGIIGARNNEFGVVGVAPDCRLYLYQAIPGDGGTIAAAIQQAISDGVQIINMSLGGYDDDQDLHDAVRQAYDANIVLVAAAGNDPTRESYPGAYPEVIAVSALDQNLQKASFAPTISNHFAMPGVNVLSTYLNNQYARESGTSFSSPIFAGLVALILSYHKAAPDQVHQCVHDALTKIEQANPDSCWYTPNLALLEQ